MIFTSLNHFFLRPIRPTLEWPSWPQNPHPWHLPQRRPIQKQQSGGCWMTWAWYQWHPQIWFIITTFKEEKWKVRYCCVLKSLFVSCFFSNKLHTKDIALILQRHPRKQQIKSFGVSQLKALSKKISLELTFVVEIKERFSHFAGINFRGFAF